MKKHNKPIRAWALVDKDGSTPLKLSEHQMNGNIYESPCYKPMPHQTWVRVTITPDKPKKSKNRQPKGKPDERGTKAL